MMEACTHLSLPRHALCHCAPHPFLPVLQERATKISHGNTARLASYYGDTLLTKICGVIAADEGRHETAYQAIVEQLFDR